jgi:hypothetical protein
VQRGGMDVDAMRARCAHMLMCTKQTNKDACHVSIIRAALALRADAQDGQSNGAGQGALATLRRCVAGRRLACVSAQASCSFLCSSAATTAPAVSATNILLVGACVCSQLASSARHRCAPCVLVSATPAALARAPAHRTCGMEEHQGAPAADTQLCHFALLPHALLLLILALLPVDTRLRCAEVCRGWRAALAERSLWGRLALSPESGVATRRLTDALLRAAALRAGGALLSLAVTDCPAISYEALLAVVTANAATLQEARLCLGASRELSCAQLEALLRAAPLLCTLHADVTCTAAEARRLLRNEPPFEALRVRRLVVSAFVGGDAATLELAADLTTHAAAHASLEELCLVGAHLDAAVALDTVVEAALACRLRRLELFFCHLSPASAPALALLLGGGALTTLHLSSGGIQLLDEPAAVLLGAALRANTTLTSLGLQNTSLWQEPAAGVSLLNALTAHRSLCELQVGWNGVGTAQQQAGASLGALIAANAPTRRSLDIDGSFLGDAGMGPLVDALPHNTHLQTIDCGANGMSDAFVRERLLPAVRPGLACTHDLT